MHALVSAIAIAWNRNGAYGLRLIEDLSARDWLAQPDGVRGSARLNHPAWIFSHLNLYHPICEALLRGEPIEDPIEHRFGPRSVLSDDVADFAPPESLRAGFERGHERVIAALRAAEDGDLGAPTPVVRWACLYPTVGDLLLTLMVKHESHHLGQLSAWRRVRGLPRVQM
ncbi:MAG: DinB family protein [Phycisphaerae bacterium]|nr:DinB family protein [Phycisphaerae bacterium]